MAFLRACLNEVRGCRERDGVCPSFPVSYEGRPLQGSPHPQPAYPPVQLGWLVSIPSPSAFISRAVSKTC